MKHFNLYDFVRLTGRHPKRHGRHFKPKRDRHELDQNVVIVTRPPVAARRFVNVDLARFFVDAILNDNDTAPIMLSMLRVKLA